MKKVRFEIDPKQDVSIFFGFLDTAEQGDTRYLEQGVFARYPECKKWFSEGKWVAHPSDVASFVEDTYSKSAAEFRENLLKKEEAWRSVEKNFFNLTSDIFGTTEWPAGKYILYATIWGSCPYSPFEMTSHFPIHSFDNDYTNTVIAHEMLHFIFFAHYPQFAPKDEKNFDTQHWHTAEIFNAVVQNTKKWRDVFEVAPTPYEEHLERLAVLTHKYSEVNKSNLSELVEDILAIKIK